MREQTYEKYLPITENVRFRTYTYYSYHDAIVSNSFRTGKMAASVYVEGYDENVWKSEEERLHAESQQLGYITFNAEKFNFSMNAFVYRPLLFTDEQTIEIEYQQSSQPWGSIGMFISDAISFDQSKYVHQIGRFCTGGLFYKNNGMQTNYEMKSYKKCVIKMKKEGDLLSFFINNEETGELELVEKRSCDQNLYLGVYVSLYDNIYYDWLFSNYFQIKANTNADDVFLEFDNAIKKNWRYYTTNYFIDYNEFSISSLMESDADICKYIKVNIDQERYIEMDIDHFDILGTHYYHEINYIHICLFYGYDEEEKMFSVLCIDDSGLVVKGKITYDTLMTQAVKNINGTSENKDLIVTATYMPDQIPYALSKEHIITSAKAFLEGKSLFDMKVMMPENSNYLYGIGIYDYLLEHIGIVLEDIRVAHLLLEHKQCMLERIEYLVLKEYIEQSDGEWLLEQVKHMIKLSTIIRTCVLRNKYMLRDSSGSTVEKNLKELKQCEYDFMMRLMNI